MLPGYRELAGVLPMKAEELFTVMSDGLVLCKLVNKAQPGTHFMCFTRTKVQILTPEELRAR
jgi:hypothetical protein